MNSKNSLTQRARGNLTQRFIDRYRFLELRKSMVMRESMPISWSLSQYTRSLIFRARKPDSFITEMNEFSLQKKRDDDDGLVDALSKKLKVIRHT